MTIFTYIIPQFNPLPTSLLTIGTLFGLLLFIRKALLYLHSYQGKTKPILICFAAVILFQIPFEYFYAVSNIKIVFISGCFLIILIFGRAITQQDNRVFDKLIFAYGAILTISMFWFLLTYFSNTLYDLHLKIYQVSDPHALFSRQRSGLTEHLHLFGYQISVLSMFLINGSLAFHGKRRLIFMALTLLIGITIVLAGERSVIIAVGVGVFALATKTRYRLRKLPLFLAFAAIYALCIFITEINVSQNASSQTDLSTRLQSKNLLSESFNRIQLQWYGLLTIIDYPQGIVLADKNWADVINSRNSSIFRTWGRVIAVHNGYLDSGIKYGLPIFIAIIALLYWLVRLALALLSIRRTNIKSDWRYTALGSALIASLVQAMFHNASFLTFEPSSVIVVFLSMAAYSRHLLFCKYRHAYENNCNHRLLS